MSKRITDFANAVCDLYGLNRFQFLEELEDEKINDDVIEELSKNLGLSKEEILNLDEDAGRRYWERYPFFKYFVDYLEAMEWEAENYPYHTREEAILEVLFGDIEFDDFPEHMQTFNQKKRYDFENVEERMVEKLKEIDEYMPGTYHEGAEIKELTFETDVVTYFAFLPEMMSSFFDMVNFVKEKFFEGLHKQLSTVDILEYNFLVNYLQIYDIANPRMLLTYENLQKYKAVYIEENYTDFFSYAKIKGFIDAAPWCCSNFFADQEIVRKFVECFPGAKALMRNYSIGLGNFICEFVWSDMDIAVKENTDERAGSQPEGIRILVPKTKEEVRGWEKHIALLKRAISPASMGGLAVPEREYQKRGDSNTKRLMKRVMMKEGV